MSLEKVINSLLQDKITAEDCRKALQELASMKQAQSDLGKVVDGLKNERETLLAETEKIKAKLTDADSQAAEIVLKAKAKADEMNVDAVKKADALCEKAKAEYARLDEVVKSKRVEADNAMDAAGKAKAKLDQINTELEAAKAKLQRMLG